MITADRHPLITVREVQKSIQSCKVPCVMGFSDHFLRTPFMPFNHKYGVISGSVAQGQREYQEDRFIVNPSLLDGDLLQLGVFDGTVGCHVSEYISQTFTKTFLATKAFAKFSKLSKKDQANRENYTTQSKAIYECFSALDKDVLAFCERHQYHYSCTTAVVTFLHFPSQLLFVAHIGDSHSVIGIGEEELSGMYLTKAHKPDSQDEYKRITSHGGVVVQCSNRVFVRGGDAVNRPDSMQLSYSRAFGAKDQKPYGVIATPSIRVVKISTPSTHPTEDLVGEKQHMLFLGSDGVCDVMPSNDIVQHLAKALQEVNSEIATFSTNEQAMTDFYNSTVNSQNTACSGEIPNGLISSEQLSPAHKFLRKVLDTQGTRNMHDNCTAIVVYFPQNIK